MGMANGRKPLPFGHSAEAAVDIEDLTLLEDHLAKLQEENPGDNGEDDEAAWKDWDIETDSDSSDSDEWINADSDGPDHLSISDSEDEKDENTTSEPAAQGEPETSKRVSSLATTKILTPADFALLNDLRLQAASKAVEKGGGSAAKRKLATLEANKAALGDVFISENDILGPRKKAKADYAERIASIEKGREGREKFGSMKGKKKKDVPSSSTNKEKARNKPFMMVMSSGAVRSKKKASLRDKQQRLRKHIDQAKKSR